MSGLPIMMRKLIVTFESFDVVVVPFPFTDTARHKRRPALVLSSSKRFNTAIGHSVMAMITSARNSPWPLDTKLEDLAAAGLKAESVVRLKLFTLDHRLIISKTGHLSKRDRAKIGKNLEILFHD